MIRGKPETERWRDSLEQVKNGDENLENQKEETLKNGKQSSYHNLIVSLVYIF